MPALALETERLVLRPLRIDDFERYVEIWQNEVMVRHITGSPISREASWARLLRAAGHWQWMGFGYFGVIERGSGLLIGEVGVQDMRREMSPSLEGTLEAGWGLLPEFHGRGLAHEAASAVIGWAERTLPPMEFTAIIDPGNEASHRLALKLGFSRDVETDYAGSPTVIYRRPGTPKDGRHNAPSYPPRN